MQRTPSLRELRRALPDKVVILPTAPDRQVKQNSPVQMRQARRELRDAQSREFPYQLPSIRERKRLDSMKANATAHIRRTPEMLIALSVFGMMDEPTRRGALAIARLVAMAGDAAGNDALVMMEQVANLTSAAKELAATNIGETGG